METSGPARTAQPAPRAWPCTRALRGITRTGPRRRSSGSSCVTGAKHRTAHRRGCVVAQETHPIARNVVGKKRRERGEKGERRAGRAGNKPRFSSQEKKPRPCALLTRRLRGEIFCLDRPFGVSVDRNRRSHFFNRCPSLKPVGTTVCAPFFARRSRTRDASTMVVGELLFTGMTDWKQVGRGKPTVRDFASPVASASRTRRDRVPTRASSD